MNSLVEQFAGQIGWTIGRNNVVVEGTSDVEFLSRASELHARSRGRPVLDAEFAVIAAGRGDEGGVEGVNRRLNMMRQLIDMDRDEAGAYQHRFVGLLDNDAAGRGAFAVASRFDRRVEPYVDIFLLHPVLPTFRPGLDRSIEVARVNQPFSRLDWEIEDLCPERVLSAFERQHPGAVLSRTERNGRVHRELDKRAKPKLRRMFVQTATFEDAAAFLGLLKTLRAYLGLEHDFVGR